MSKHQISRRQFLGRGAQSAGLMAAMAGGAAAAQREPKPAHVSPNRYAYPNPARPTDPKWLHYEQISQVRCPRPDPKRVVVDSKDNLLVIAGKYLTCLDASGATRAEIVLSAPVRCAAVAADGAIYAGLKDHIEVFDAAGQRRAAWEIPAKRAWFTGLALGEQDLFAADAVNRVVLHYDLAGKIIGRIGEKDARRNIPGFIIPSPFFDLKLGSDGLLRVANSGRHQVETYTTGGHLEFSWGKPSTAIEGFCGCCNPINLAMLPEGRVVTCEKGLPRVKVYSAQGELLSVVAGHESFPESARRSALDPTDHVQSGLDVAVDSRERIYILDWASAQVRIMARKPDAPKLAA